MISGSNTGDETLLDSDLVKTGLGEAYFPASSRRLLSSYPQERKFFFTQWEGRELVHLSVALLPLELREWQPGIQFKDLAFPCGHLLFSVTLPRSRGQGIGSRSVAARCDWLQSQGVPTAWTLSWFNREGVSTSAGILGRLGFRSHLVLHRCWAAQCDRTPGFCPSQNPSLPCVCSARVFRKDFPMGSGSRTTGR